MATDWFTPIADTFINPNHIEGFVENSIDNLLFSLPDVQHNLPRFADALFLNPQIEFSVRSEKSEFFGDMNASEALDVFISCVDGLKGCISEQEGSQARVTLHGHSRLIDSERLDDGSGFVFYVYRPLDA